MARVFPGWWQVGVALLLNAASSASIFTAYSVIAVPLEAEFQPGRALLMMGITAANLAAGLLAPLGGAAIDRFSVRRLMGAGCAILGGGFWLLSLTSSMAQVVAVYVLLAVGAVFTGPMASAALLARWFERHRGLAMSLAAAGGALGGLLIPPLLQALIELLDWRAALRAYGLGLFLITAPATWLWVRDHPRLLGLHPDGAAPSSPTLTAPSAGIGWRDLATDGRFWLVAGVLGILLGAPVGLLSNLVPFALEKGLTPAEGALLLSVFSAANFAGKLLAGPAADRMGQRALLALLLVTLAASLSALVPVAALAPTAAVIALVGMAQGAVVPLWSLILAELYGPGAMGRAMGLMSLAIMPFTLAAPPLFGLGHDLTGSYALALSSGAALLLAALPVVAVLRPAPAPTA
ncbi:MAG: putative MFS-type transporter YcxA [Porticoccaceae bacterium]|nr:MAG: putative MFS-type transporter YcxA [Porticoccaceae bacterium]